MNLAKLKLEISNWKLKLAKISSYEKTGHTIITSIRQTKISEHYFQIFIQPSVASGNAQIPIYQQVSQFF